MHLSPILLEAASDAAHQWSCSQSYSCQRLILTGLEVALKAAWIILEGILEHWH